MADRRAIHAYLSESSHDTWHGVAEKAGVSLSGLLESVAIDLRDNPPETGGHARWDEVVAGARRVDAQRRRRSRS